MADENLDPVMALALSNAAIIDSLLFTLRRKKLISSDEHHELYDSALLMLEQLQGTAPNNATMEAARARLQTFEKAARTR